MRQQYCDRGVWSRHITKSRYFDGYIRVYSAKTLVSRREHKIAIAKILTQRSRLQRTTMHRSFGTKISGNRRPRAELLETVRARIITALEAGVLKLKIAAEYCVNQSTVYNTIN